MPRIAVVYHPNKVRLPALQRAIEKAMPADWDPILWLETTPDEAGQALAAEALAAGVDAVAAAGGDGTVRAVAETLRGTGVPLVILPQGTGNVFARNLGIPVGTIGAFDAQLEIAFGGEDREVDVGRVELARESGERETHVFLIMAGIGLDAAMIQHTRPELKKAVGWVAYLDGIARAIPSAQPFRVTYRIDGRPSRSMVVHSIAAANCGTVPGGIRMLPDAKTDDGLLDVAAIRPRGALGWVRIWNTFVIENGILRQTRFGRRVADWRSRHTRDVVYRQARSASLQVERPVAFQIDGEDGGEIVAAQVDVEPGALLVRVP